MPKIRRPRRKFIDDLKMIKYLDDYVAEHRQDLAQLKGQTGDEARVARGVVRSFNQSAETAENQATELRRKHAKTLRRLSPGTSLAPVTDELISEAESRYAATMAAYLRENPDKLKVRSSKKKDGKPEQKRADASTTSGTMEIQFKPGQGMAKQEALRSEEEIVMGGGHARRGRGQRDKKGSRPSKITIQLHS